MYNNTLGYIYTVSTFVRAHSALCMFCSLTGNPDDERETPHHLFYAYAAVENVQIKKNFTGYCICGKLRKGPHFDYAGNFKKIKIHLAKFGYTVGFLITGKFLSLILLTYATLTVQIE